ncbi:transposase [Gemmata massiliana]|uniref:transposase n=1 Tax=Gemmata massiliana TaxID=1210884 RepID=UPI0036F3A2D4
MARRRRRSGGVARARLELKRLPSYSPQLNVIERFWTLLRRRHPQPTVRHDRRPEALDPQQHLLLTDRPLADPIPHR